MGIMSGHERDWIKIMLQDKKIAEHFGLPDNITETQVDEVIEIIANTDGFMQGLMGDGESMFGILNQVSFKENNVMKKEDETPCEWLLREAIEDMVGELNIDELEPINVVKGTELKVGEFYQITFPSGDKAKVKLNRILKNSFGDDFIFENISGAERLVSKSAFSTSNEFPLPYQLLSETIFHTLG